MLFMTGSLGPSRPPRPPGPPTSSSPVEVCTFQPGATIGSVGFGIAQSCPRDVSSTYGSRLLISLGCRGHSGGRKRGLSLRLGGLYLSLSLRLLWLLVVLWPMLLAL